MYSEELNIDDYIEICKEAGNYKQAIFWCDLASAKESEYNDDDDNNDDNLIKNLFKFEDNKKSFGKLKGIKSIEYLLEMGILYMLDGREICIESVLKRIDMEELEYNENLRINDNKLNIENEEDIDLIKNENIEIESNSIISKKLFLESQYLYSIHRYEECLSLIESSIDLSNYNTFISSSIHTMAADSFSSIGNIEYATMLYETALYESHYAIESLDYLLSIPYCSENTKYNLLNNIINSPINEIDKSWLQNYLHPFIQSTKDNIDNNLFKSISPSISPTKKREKRLLPTSPINVTSRISINNSEKIVFKNYYIGKSDNKNIYEDINIIENIAKYCNNEIGLKLSIIYLYRFLCHNNNTCAYILGCNIWMNLFKSNELVNNYNFGDNISIIFNDNYKIFKYSTSTICEFINMFSLCIVCKLYSEISICQNNHLIELNDYISLLESFIVILRNYGGETEIIKKSSIDSSLIFSTKLFNSKLFGKNSDDICCGINFNGNNLGNDLNYGNENYNNSNYTCWYKKLFPYNITASSFFFVKGCYLFVSAFNMINIKEKNIIQTVRSLLRTSMYYLKKSINFNYIMLPAYYLWGNIYSILGQYDDAIVIFRRIIRLFPSTNLSITSAISLLLQRVQLEKDLHINDLINQCIGWSIKGLQINKDIPTIHNSLGICAYYEKKYDIAIGYFQKAFYYLSNENYYDIHEFHTKYNFILFNNPGYPKYNSSLFTFNLLPFIISVNLALSYLMGGHYENAIECLLVLFSSKKYFHYSIFEPTIIQYIYIILGISYHLLENYKQACNYYELFLSLPFQNSLLDEIENEPSTSNDLNSIKIPGNDAVQMLITGDQNKYLCKLFIKNISELYHSIIQLS